MENLFNKTEDFNGNVLRNINSLRESVNLFDDLDEGDPDLTATAIAAEMDVRKHLTPASPAIIHRPFHYSTALGPGRSLHTRFGDGSFGVWYGSLELETTIHETVFHMIKHERGVEGIDGIIIRERAVYQVHASAILIDLRSKQIEYPGLVSNDYTFAQGIGRRLHGEGHPGLLTPSARCKGTNLVAFKPSILSDPRNYCFLTYFFDVRKQTVTVERGKGEILFREIQAID